MTSNMNRRQLLKRGGASSALLGVGDLTPLLAPRMRVGPFVPELLTYRRATQLRLVRQAQELGLDALGACLWPIVPGGTETLQYPVPFASYDLRWATNQYLSNLEALVNALDKAGIHPYMYGPVFPDVRRHYPIFERMRFRARDISYSDWSRWSPLAHNAWTNFLLRIHAEYGDALTYIDAVEPFTHHLPRPPNHFTQQMRQVLPGILSAGVDEVHFNPGDADPPRGRVVVSDGWGRSSRQWQWQTDKGTEIRRPLAGLPGDCAIVQRQAKAHVAEYFVYVAVVAAKRGADTFLVLHTAGWSVANYQEAWAQAADPENYQGHPAVASLHAPPFGHIYRQLVAA